jgi:hypothetical protein
MHPSPAVIATFDSRFERLLSEQAARPEGVPAAAISSARELVVALKECNVPLPFVYPLDEGGFSFEWRHNDKRNHLLLEITDEGVTLFDVALNDDTNREITGLNAQRALVEVLAVRDLVGHTGHGVSDAEIQRMLECIAVAIEMTNGEDIARAERAGLAFIATWPQAQRVEFAGDLAVVAMQAMESCTAHIFEVFVESCRPKIETGRVDPERIAQLLQ